MDYFDHLIDKEKLLSRLEFCDEVRVNNYRYTLIIGVNCFDFIIRDGKPIMLYSDKTQFKVMISEHRALYRAEMSGYFTHFIGRLKPYNDSNGLCKRLGVSHVVLQDFGKDLESNSSDVKTPKYDLSCKIYKNPILSKLGFNNDILNSEVISNIINNS